MRLNELFRAVAAIAEEFEDAGISVVGVETPGGQCTPEDPSLELTVDLSPADVVDAPGSESLVPREAETTEDGDVRVTLGIGADTAAIGTNTRGSGGPAVAREPDGSEHDDEATRDDETPDVPAYRDPAKLQAVYDEDASFREMTAALDVDVTPQTVRRYMIEHDIHVPASARKPETDSRLDDPGTDSDEEQEPEAEEGNGESPGAADGDATPADVQTNTDDGTGGSDDDTADAEAGGENASGEPRDGAEDDGDPDGAPATTDEHGAAPGSDDVTEGASNGADADSSAYEADGGGVGELETPGALPEGVTLDDVQEAVSTSRTVYEVQRALGTDREHTRELLDEFNLLECVTGRLANAEEVLTADQVEERIRMALSN